MYYRAQDRELKASHTIKNLREEVDELRKKSERDPNTLDKFIKNDYFYNEVNSIPKAVKFATDKVAQDGTGSNDAVDNYMDQRPSRASVMGRAGAKANTTRSFVTN